MILKILKTSLSLTSIFFCTLQHRPDWMASVDRHGQGLGRTWGGIAEEGVGEEGKGITEGVSQREWDKGKGEGKGNEDQGDEDNWDDNDMDEDDDEHIGHCPHPFIIIPIVLITLVFIALVKRVKASGMG